VLCIFPFDTLCCGTLTQQARTDTHPFRWLPPLRIPGAAIVQAGFILTAGVSLLWTAQMAHVLHPFIPPGPLCSRMLALAGVPVVASFLIDAHHRTCFLCTATGKPCGAAGSTVTTTSCSSYTHSTAKGR
jgi:hypothetical protein